MATGMTTSEAATHLQVSERSVRNYIAQGLLTVFFNGRKRLLNPTDVEELRLDRTSVKKNALLPAAEIHTLRAKVRKLESQMAVVLRILDAKDEPLGVTGEAASRLYDACVAQTKASEWALDELTPWSEILLRVTEDDLVEMQQASITKPWRPFLQLVSLMMSYVARLPDFRTSLDLQVLHKTFAEAKRRLRVATTLFIEVKVGASEEIERYLTDGPRSIRDALGHALKA